MSGNNTDRPVVLVTGGAGYIGSHACKALSLSGYQPVVYDNLIYGHREFVRWGPLEEGDLADQARLREVFLKHRPVAVMHFAAFTYVGESVSDPGKYYRNNVLGSLHLLEVMRETGVQMLVFSSTCATYGIPGTIPIPEDHPQHPINPYGASKLMMERMMADFSVAHGLNYLALRYFNAAGGDPDAEIGERHDPETHLIPLVLDAAMGKRPHVTVFGTDYPTPDGTCIRDYIHVSDLADAHVLALEYLRRERRSGALNLGNGSGYSVKEVIATAERVTGASIRVVLGARREGDPPRLVGNAVLAKSMLGWKPQYADLQVIIRHAWEYRRRGYEHR
ncbi:MAG TPA: UDP-glucose 4-epimerase GalE [Candidatus Ozemobacteraceae bacterium]|nr:UDP-glucose 4-epimerase GalE [Candidatus Ozemobacteraceae bacterium]